MLRTFAVALLAASVFTAPVLAQGNGSTATPPVKTESTATPKVVNSDLKAAKVKTSKRYAHRHAKHLKHVAHVKRVKHVKTAKMHRAKGTAQVHHETSKVTTGANGTMTAPKAKSNVN